MSAQVQGSSIDSNQRVSTALPAAGSTATPSTALDLGVAGGRNQTLLKLQISVPATANLADTKTITFKVYDCDTSDGTYTEVEGYGNMIQTGAGGVGDSADEWILRIHDHVRRYVKVKATVEASGGNNTAVSYVMETLF